MPGAEVQEGGGLRQGEVRRTCRIVIVAAVRLYRDGLALALSRDHGFDVVGTARDIDTAAAVVAPDPPDLVVLDMGLADSLELARGLAGGPDAPRVVALAIPETEESVLACAEAGIAAYVPRDASLDELAAALRRAACGEVACSPRMAGMLMRRVAVLAAERPGFPHESPLTARESEIVVLLDEGLSNKEIAQRLFIEVATVKNHVHNILDKLNVSRRGQAAARMRALQRHV
jgi:DNA-binding NarL/FixJ family response regulator